MAGIHYTHRIDGEQVTVTGHVNGITIYDSEDEEGQELLDDVFAEMYEPTTAEYTVTVSNKFDAVSYEDAVKQMVAWLDDNAAFAGYRVSTGGDDMGNSVFIDAEKVL
jgi:hypothetical protein